MGGHFINGVLCNRLGHLARSLDDIASGWGSDAIQCATICWNCWRRSRRLIYNLRSRLIYASWYHNWCWIVVVAFLNARLAGIAFGVFCFGRFAVGTKSSCFVARCVLACERLARCIDLDDVATGIDFGVISSGVSSERTFNWRTVGTRSGGSLGSRSIRCRRSSWTTWRGISPRRSRRASRCRLCRGCGRWLSSSGVGLWRSH